MALYCEKLQKMAVVTFGMRFLNFVWSRVKSTCCFSDQFFVLSTRKLGLNSVNCFLRLIPNKTQYNTYSDLQKNGEGTALASVGSSKTNIASIYEMIINFLSIVLVSGNLNNNCCRNLKPVKLNNMI